VTYIKDININLVGFKFKYFLRPTSFLNKLKSITFLYGSFCKPYFIFLKDLNYFIFLKDLNYYSFLITHYSTVKTQHGGSQKVKGRVIGGARESENSGARKIKIANKGEDGQKSRRKPQTIDSRIKRQNFERKVRKKKKV